MKDMRAMLQLWQRSLAATTLDASLNQEVCLRMAVAMKSSKPCGGCQAAREAGCRPRHAAGRVIARSCSARRSHIASCNGILPLAIAAWNEREQAVDRHMTHEELPRIKTSFSRMVP